MTSTIESVEGVAHHRVPPPLDPALRDPYSGELLTAENMTQHAPDDRCLWVARHPVTVCGHRGHPGYTWDPTRKEWLLNPRPVTAADLSEVPRALAQPEERAPWEATP